MINESRFAAQSHANSQLGGNDQIQVRIRGKNNFVETKTGSVTRTLNEINEEQNRRKEIAKAAERLKMLEKLEDYREKKMQQEIEILEMERMKEQ